MDEWERGVLMAASTLIAQHDQPGMAADLLLDLGCAHVDCKELDDFDKVNLKQVNGMRGSKTVKLKGLRIKAAKQGGANA